MLGAFAAILQRTRQHHAIEHATIHLLAARFPHLVLAGMSDPWGFTLFGHLSREAIEDAVAEALRRLQAGEEKLAYHPNCGTNLTTSILLVTAAALLGSIDWRHSHLRPPEGAPSLDTEGQPAVSERLSGRRAIGRSRSLLDRITMTAGLMTLALLVSGPLGMRLQRLTTLTTVGDRELAKVVPVGDGRAYRITFAKLQ